MTFLFEPVEPLNLGLCRVLFYGAFFLYYLAEDFSAWATVSESFWMPIGVFELSHLPILSGGSLVAMQGVWKVSLAMSCVGLFTRASTISSFVLGAYLLGLPHNFGKVHHFDALVVIVLGIMAIFRCGDACSIDRSIRRAITRTRSPAESPRSGEYTWPVRTVWLTFALIFFAAGTSKLRHSGLEWVLSDHVANLLIGARYGLYGADPLVTWGATLVQHDWLPRLIAAATVALEVAYPLALFSRRARWILVPGVFLMQVGIRVFMGPAFYPFLICNLFWVPWDRVSHALTRSVRSQPARRENTKAHTAVLVPVRTLRKGRMACESVRPRTCLPRHRRGCSACAGDRRPNAPVPMTLVPAVVSLGRG